MSQIIKPLDAEEKGLLDELTKLTQKNFDRENRFWKNDDGTRCSGEQEKIFQAKFRELRAKVIFIGQERIVLENGDPKDPNVLRLMPLVSRRKHRELWAKIGTGKTQEDLDIINFGNVSMTHTIGNWDCKGCLNLGVDITSAEDVSNALSTGKKAVEWCPRFLPMLRHMPLLEYIKLVKTSDENPLCYAGLIHSEMTFEDIEEEVPSISPDQIAVEPTMLITKRYVVITKYCDTCGYCVEERKEYSEPEQIKDGETLRTFADDKSND
jgi:hypothetical protein